jgi:hypothetical protein
MLMVRHLILYVIIFSAALFFMPSNYAQDRWETAVAEVKRLKPSAFPALPESVQRHLQNRGCLIPQTWTNSKPHNVVRGELIKAGQHDWAVLCSRGGISTIMVYLEGTTTSVSELNQVADMDYLQVIDGDGRIGYSRFISAVDREFILDSYRSYGGAEPPQIDHQGINDEFIEKASIVHYNHRGEWIKLHGTD